MSRKTREIVSDKEEVKQNMLLDKCNAVAYWLLLFKHQVPYAILLSIFTPITIILNLSLIASFIATQQITHNTSNIVIFVLSLIDLITGAISMPLTANVLLHLNEDDTCTKSKVLIILNNSGQASIILTSLLALDRYLHMNPDILNRPSRMKKILKVPSIYYVLMFVFIIVNALSFAIAFELNQKVTGSIAMFFTILLSIQLIFIVCLYTRGYLRIRRFADNSPVYNEPIGSTPDYVRKLYKTVLIIVSLTFIQYIPYSIVSIALAVHHSPVQLSSNPIFAYCFEFATLSLRAGTFTNCLAILHFNNRAKNWILHKTGLQRISQQDGQN